MMKRFRKVFLYGTICLLFVMPQADAGSRLLRGTARTLISTVEIPRTMVEHSKNAVFPFGLISGAVVGVFRTAFGIVTGVADMAIGALPLAKYAALFV